MKGSALAPSVSAIVTVVALTSLFAPVAQAQSGSKKTLQATVNGIPTVATIERFINVGNQIFAVATLPQPVEIPSTGETLQRLMVPVIASPLVSAQQTGETCEVLVLRIGMLELELLGLVIEIDAATIVLSAQEDSLLGNLLCPIVNLLETGQLDGVSALLNRVLDRL